MPASPRWPKAVSTESGPPPVHRVHGREIRVTWIGHATTLVQTAEANFLTDPVWSSRLGGSRWRGPRRVAHPGVRLSDLPRLDVILISSDRPGHYCPRSLRALAMRSGATVIAPASLQTRLVHEGFQRVDCPAPGQPFSWENVSISACQVNHSGPESSAAYGYRMKGVGGTWIFFGDADRFSLQTLTGSATVRLSVLPGGLSSVPPCCCLTVNEIKEASQRLKSAYTAVMHVDTFPSHDPYGEVRRRLLAGPNSAYRIEVPPLGQPITIPDPGKS